MLRSKLMAFAPDPFCLAAAMSQHTYKKMVEFIKNCPCIIVPSAKHLKREDVVGKFPPPAYKEGDFKRFWGK